MIPFTQNVQKRQIQIENTNGCQGLGKGRRSDSADIRLGSDENVLELDQVRGYITLCALKPTELDILKEIKFYAIIIFKILF